jgi:hypothetical protein
MQQIEKESERKDYSFEYIQQSTNFIS